MEKIEDKESIKDIDIDCYIEDDITEVINRSNNVMTFASSAVGQGGVTGVISRSSKAMIFASTEAVQKEGVWYHLHEKFMKGINMILQRES